MESHSVATELRANSLSLFESVIMGIAGSAPGFSIAVTTAALLGSAGMVSPGALILFAIPMLGIAVAYKGLNKKMTSAGAAYEWTTQGFGKFFGFFSGWALLIASMVFMITGSVPLGTATLTIINPDLANNVLLTTSVGALWFVVIGVVLIAGIGLTSKIQVVMTTIELLVLTTVAVAAFIHTSSAGAVNHFSWSWFGLGYAPGTFAASALVVVFFYWGWDVTSNLSEETIDHPPNAAGNGGFYSVFITIAYFVAFTLAAMFLFSLSDAQGFSDNIVYHIALASGLGKVGGLLASIAVILSSIATLETTMLQFSRTLFAMGRDRAMPTAMGVVHEKTVTPVRTMYVLLAVGLVMIFLSSFLPSVGKILSDSVNAVAVQVCYYYGLAGLVSAWMFRDSFKTSPGEWLLYCLYPFLSAIALIVLGLYAISTFDTLTKIVGIGGLLIGIIFFRPSGYRSALVPVGAE
jgi:amino acid transporter